MGRKPGRKPDRKAPPTAAKKGKSHRWLDEKRLKRKLPAAPPSVLANLLRKRCKLRKDDFDPRYNYAYSEERAARLKGRRGGEIYLPPKGFAKVGLDVAKRFPKSNGDWLKKNKWPIVYHGTRARPTYVHNIIRDGFKIRGGKDSAVNGEKYGEGIYCTPDPELAVRFARKQKLDSPQGDEFVIVFQCRAKPGQYTPETDLIWRVQDPKFIRPYAILLSTEDEK